MNQPPRTLALLLPTLLLVPLLLDLGAAAQPPGARPDPDAPRPSGPLQVFILAGQSNMQGHAHVRTIGALSLSEDRAPLLAEMVDEDGEPVVCERVWISSIGSSAEEKTGRLTVGYGAEGRGPKIGPEFTFGIFAEKRLDRPVLIIKTAWGGKSLHTDFRPPSAGPYSLSEAEKARLAERGEDIEAAQAARTAASGEYYRRMRDHVKAVLADIGRVVPGYDPEVGHELAGFVWFQGWNDMVDGGVYPDRGKPGGYDAYSDLLATFIRDVRKDLSAPDLPFVIGVMGVGGPIDEYPPDQQRYRAVHGNFREAMAAPAKLPEFAGTVAAVRTGAFWDQEVSALQAREKKEIRPLAEEIEAAVKEGRATREQGEAAASALYAKSFTERELRLLRESTSNADYHYKGSARILAPIGRAFAEAAVALRRSAARD